MPDEELHGKVALVTGANSGIGYATVKGLARRGATVVMVARSEKRGRKAQRKIRRATGNPEVDLLLCDLSEQAQIRALARQFTTRYDHLDVLVNNAGLYVDDYRTSPDGHEMTWAVNHLGYFLLTLLLLDALEVSAPSRIVNVSSNAHLDATLDLDKEITPERYKGFAAYAKSKLANVLFTRELARRLEGTGVTANAVHPGMVRTRIWQRRGGLSALLARVVSLFFRSPAKGAETVLYLVASPEVEGISGQYFKDKQAVEPSKDAQDEDLARKLWEKSLKQVGLANGE